MGYTLNNIKNSPFKNLTSTYVSSNFGQRRFWNNVTGKWNTGFHSGIDITSGNTIVATARGKVTACRNNIQGYTEREASGNYVTLYHGNNTYTTYCHMRYGSVNVRVGDAIEKGQVIGVKGTTGYSTGEHLHYGIKVNGSWVDPVPYLLGERNLSQYNDLVIPSPKQTVFNKGDRVIFTGTLYRDSYGNGAGQSRTNLEATITLINPKGTHKYNINNGLGWVKESDLRKITSLPVNNKKYYTVVKGDTLWAISKRFYGNGNRYPEIAKANNIKNPDIIHVGQKLLIP